MNPPTSLKPSVGRIVLYASLGVLLAAVVTHVHNDTCVNLAVFDPNGSTFPATSVVQHQGIGDQPDCSWAWMPYQIGQAQKAEELAETYGAPKVAKHPFDYHRPSETQVQQITTVREGCKAMHATLLELPPSRERSLAITKLEEVSMWANKGIVLADEGPVTPSA